MKLEKYFILNKYLLSLFGYSSFSELRKVIKDREVGFENDGKSYFMSALMGIKDMKVSREELIRYDEIIKGYSERLGRNRRENINLKYCQYLAILFTEIYLDKYFNNRTELLSELNKFMEDYKLIEKIDISFFKEEDLKKLAYWMATGSGKTLIMHINYWQFLKYNIKPLDNIILVTPNEGMSKQHYAEMQKSGVPCKIFSEHSNNLTLYKDEVLVIDIHKLTEKKKGSGVRVETSSFEGRNLVFIDEGHKGQVTEEQTWKRLREDLGKYGFIFEYSATFGQVLRANEKKNDLLEEYSKAIIFDYSYKYFYEDGYGKDFYVCNLKEKKFDQDYKELILTGNLLSFYEQSLLYENHRDELKEYLIEKPLWAFVGSKVIGKKSGKFAKNEEDTISDVLNVVNFLKKIIENKSFLENNISRIFKEQSGLLDEEGKDIFKDRLKYIKQKGCSATDIFKSIFTQGNGTLYLYELKSAEGEIGLKIGEGDYFGVINIGDVSGFKKLLEEEGIEVGADTFTPSLFEQINNYDSNINILIGAKKFIEGWDSWRVCSMGLLNIGKGEGPQIIQLFGRGVRLKGKELSLKRSDENKIQIRSLETLNIFGLNADYINMFLKTVKDEGLGEEEEITIPIKKFFDRPKWEKLYTLKTNQDFNFANIYITLEINENILRKVKIDIRPRVSLAHGLDTSIAELEDKPIDSDLRKYFLDSIQFLNWEEIYLKIIEFKIAKGFYNLEIKKEMLREIIRRCDYKIYTFPEQIRLKSFTDLQNIEEIVLMIFKKYIKNYYYRKERREESKQLQPVYLIKDDENFSYDEYKLRVELPEDKKEREKRKERIEKIKEVLKDVDRLYREDTEEIPTIHLDQHLYTPLVVSSEKDEDFIKSEPPKLNEGETKFIKKLKEYLKLNKEKDKNREVFLLRNLSKKGVGFFKSAGFYPDFIMWVKEKDKQAIVFIDPKGILIEDEEKIRLYEYLKNDIQPEIYKKNPDINIKIDSYILANTEYSDIKRNKSEEEYEKDHVLFLEDQEDCIKKLFQKLSEE
jgi:hypothetical protein